MTIRGWIYAIGFVIVAYVVGWLVGSMTTEPVVFEYTRIDTVFYERPRPVTVSDNVITVDVPRMLFAPSDTVDRVVVIGDSTPVDVTVRTLEYRDSTYYARVVGPVVGSLVPRLDFIETYNTTTTMTHIVREPYKWSVGPGAGVWSSPMGGGVWLGGVARANLGRLGLQGAMGYDTHNEGFFGQISIGLDIWRK